VHLSDAERFDSYILKGPNPGSCWIWLGAVSDDGYGRFSIRTFEGHRTVSAHRFALSLVFGGLSAIEGRTALHHCDVPLCVKALPGPGSHLTLGTRSDNMADREMKGRHPTITTLRWRWLTRAQKAARSRMLRDQLKHKGWDPTVIRELIHGIDPTHPTLF
jgi:hypothetical protein